MCIRDSVLCVQLGSLPQQFAPEHSQEPRKSERCPPGTGPHRPALHLELRCPQRFEYRGKPADSQGAAKIWLELQWSSLPIRIASGHGHAHAVFSLFPALLLCFPVDSQNCQGAGVAPPEGCGPHYRKGPAAGACLWDLFRRAIFDLWG